MRWVLIVDSPRNSELVRLSCCCHLGCSCGCRAPYWACSYRGAQDLHVFPQPAILRPQLADLRGLLASRARPQPAVDVGLHHLAAHRLGPHHKLAGHRRSRRGGRGVLRTMLLKNHALRPKLPNLGGDVIDNKGHLGVGARSHPALRDTANRVPAPRTGQDPHRRRGSNRRVTSAASSHTAVSGRARRSRRTQPSSAPRCRGIAAGFCAIACCGTSSNALTARPRRAPP